MKPIDTVLSEIVKARSDYHTTRVLRDWIDNLVTRECVVTKLAKAIKEDHIIVQLELAKNELESGALSQEGFERRVRALRPSLG